jgi:hypothetical protein
MKVNLGKILLFVGLAGTVISLVLVFIGVFSVNNIDDSGYLWLSIVGFIVLGVSFILTAAGTIMWYLESVVDRIRARNRDAGDSQADYNGKIDKL